VDFAGRLPAIQSGTYDFTTDMNVTPERKEEVLFSDPTSNGGIVLAVLADDLAVSKQAEYQSFEELNGKTVSMLTGAPFENLIASKVSDVKEFTYFQTMPDMVLALKTGKTDAGFMNNAVAELAANRDAELAVFPKNLGETFFGLAFAKGDEKCAAWQKAYDAIPEEIKEELWTKWTGADDSKKTVPKQDWPGENGIINVAACDALEPMSYLGQDGELLGLDIETILIIARELDVHVNFTPMDFSAVLSSIGAGKADVGCGSIVTTDERKETMDFVEYCPASYVLIVRAKKEDVSDDSFLGGIKASFEKTFIREDRYKLFLSGVLTTILITLLSILFGTILGFLLYMGCRNGNKVADKISGVCVWLIQGMPVVVLLMILYYIIFAKSQISGTLVAIIAFTLVFGCGVFGMLKMGVGAIDKGQTEAALALGYGDVQTFFRIILPQAIPHFLPAYKGESVALVKATAIVGYIAVQDLTKMGDIVRGRTYEAFFPLIAVAVIYFILGGALTFLVGRVEKILNPRRRRREDILKGVSTDD
jgi:polar amino acid transport system substrate-binding protein